MKKSFRVFGQTKECKMCGRERLRTSFYHHPNSRDKLFGVCKFCASERAKGNPIVFEKKSVSERIKEYFSDKNKNAS